MPCTFVVQWLICDVYLVLRGSFCTGVKINLQAVNADNKMLPINLRLWLQTWRHRISFIDGKRFYNHVLGIRQKCNLSLTEVLCFPAMRYEWRDEVMLLIRFGKDSEQSVHSRHRPYSAHIVWFRKEILRQTYDVGTGISRGFPIASSAIFTLGGPGLSVAKMFPTHPGRLVPSRLVVWYPNSGRFVHKLL